MSGFKSLAYDNNLTSLNNKEVVHMHNINRNVRSVIFVKTAKNPIVLKC